MKMIIAIIILVLIVSSTSTQRAIAKRQNEMVREQARQAREYERLERQQEREWERQRKEDERRDAMLKKHEEQIDKLYFRIEKCEDEIAHFSELADKLTDRRNEMQAEIDSINVRLEHADGTLDPLNASRDSRFSDEAGALLYMDMYASTLDNGKTKKQKQADSEKLAKRRDTLQNKVITLDNRIFAAEQKIKKATHEKEIAEKALA